MKYYLSLDWEIIPREGGVEFTHLSEKSENFYAHNEPGVEVIKLVCSLKAGLEDAGISPANAALFSRLKSFGVIKAVKKSPPTKYPQNYLGLLEKHFVGFGRIVESVATTHNEQGFTVTEAKGFGSRFILHQPSLNYGWGADSSSLMASIKAVVECIERYSLSSYNEKSLFKANWADIKSKSMSPVQLNTSHARLQNTKSVEWQRLGQLNGDDHIYAPLDFLYHPVDYWSLGRLPICQMDISGVAGHQSKAAALVNALLELCEHEALMLAWFGQRKTPTIKTESLDPESQGYIKRLGSLGCQVFVKDISLDLTPVVMVIAIGPRNKRALTIGSNAAFSAKYAAKKAVSEVLRTVLTEKESGLGESLFEETDVNDISTHSRYYSQHENLKKAEFLWASDREVEASDQLTHGRYKGKELRTVQKEWETAKHLEKQELQYLADVVFRPKSLDIFIDNITPREIRKTKTPLVIMRAVVPEMTRLIVGYNQKPAQTKRYKALFKKFGTKEQNVLAKVHPFS